MNTLHRRTCVIVGATITLVVAALFMSNSNNQVDTAIVLNEVIEPTIEAEFRGENASSTKNELSSTTTSSELDSTPALKSTQTSVTKVESKEKTVKTEVPITSEAKTLKFSSTDMLKAHNAVRSSVGISNLSWSETLAKSSQVWSDTLQSEDCKFHHDLSTPYGENIYWAWSTRADGTRLVSNPKDSVEWWAAEEAFYNYQKNTCKAGEECGHYTQIVWRTTTEVGCSVSICLNGDKQTDMWVCRYNPAGNDGTQPY
ncbi:MAG: hypothetical protein K9M10_01525 [Candidatus Pacebacteria bacterium]|nr:hypothetical protein [Candidatus Paceibacterota bacterium]MCF7857143.1 hypothetical protein [Candidatus Paceibacterota bacterium]